MSSKASEILGVSSKQPHNPHRRHISSRDGDSLLSSLSSRRPSQLGERPVANQSTLDSSSRAVKKRERRGHPTSKNSVESIPLSVRFADKSLASGESQSTVRSSTLREPASPSVASTRAAPSAWRSLASRAGGSSMSIGSRTSQESISTLQSQSVKELPPRNRTLLRSALSRLTLRPSKSRASLASGRESQYTSVASTAVQTASTTRQGTPRALSPTGIRYEVTPNPAYTAQDGRQTPSGKPKRRQNSRMPTEVERPPTRNWYDGLEETDFDDAVQSSYSAIAPSQTPLQSSSHTVIHTTQKATRHFSRPLVVPPRPPSDLEAHPRDLPERDTISAVDGRISRATILSNHSPRKRRSKPPELAPHDYSILNLSDSDEDQAPAPDLPRKIGHAYGRTAKRDSAESTAHPKRETVILRPPPIPSTKTRKSAPRAVSAMRVEDDMAETSPSLPSLVESGSSRQTSFVSSTSQGRPSALDSIATNNTSASSRAKIINVHHLDSMDYDARGSSEQTRLIGGDSEDEGSLVAARDKNSFGNSGSSAHVMTVLSPEEAAWLAHMRRNRAETLQKLNPTPQSSTSVGQELQREVSVRDFEEETQHRPLPTVIEAASPDLQANEWVEQHRPSQMEYHDRGASQNLYSQETMVLSETEYMSHIGEQGDAPYPSTPPRKDVVDPRDLTPAPSSPETVELAISAIQETKEVEEAEEAEDAAEAENADETDETQIQSDINRSTNQNILGLEEEGVDAEQEFEESAHPNSSTAEPQSVPDAQRRLEHYEASSPNQDQEHIAEAKNESRPRKTSISYAEARSRFEKTSGSKSALPVPKRMTGKAVNGLTLSEQKQQSPRIPVAVSRLRQYQPVAYATRSKQDVSDENISIQDDGLAASALTNFPQPPGSNDLLVDDIHEDLPEDLQLTIRDSVRPKRRDTGARDVLEAWQALGGG